MSSLLKNLWTCETHLESASLWQEMRHRWQTTYVQFVVTKVRKHFAACGEWSQWISSDASRFAGCGADAGPKPWPGSESSRRPAPLHSIQFRICQAVRLVPTCLTKLLTTTVFRLRWVRAYMDPRHRLDPAARDLIRACMHAFAGHVYISTGAWTRAWLFHNV